MRFVFNTCLVLCLIANLLPVTAPAVYASEYTVEIFDHLCPETADETSYTSRKLKALQYLTEGKDGWIYRSRDDFETDFGISNSYAGLKAFTSYLASHGTQLLLVYLPTRALMTPAFVPVEKFDYQKALAAYLAKVEKLRSLGILVPDMAHLIATEKNSDFYFKRDIHWTPYGSRATARIVASAVTRAGINLPQIPLPVVNKPMGTYSIKGVMQKGIQQICGETYIPQYVQWFGPDEDGNQGGNADDSGLFQEEEEAEVILIGTSFSIVERLNFSGFLEEYLETPIENFALKAGQDMGSWLKYIANGEFARHPPKLIIWEISSYYLLDDSRLFAQLIPGIRGGYAEHSPVLHTDTILTADMELGQSLFFTDKLSGIPLSELVIKLDFSDTDINALKFKLWYTNGKVKKAGIKKPARAETGGHFLFSLFGELLQPAGDMMALEITEIEGMPVVEYLKEQGVPEIKVQTNVYRLPPLDSKAENKNKQD